MEQGQLVQRARWSFTRLARFIYQLMREQLSGTSVTVQQCYTLEALMHGPKSMKALAGEVALHQSTLTRVVEKLERQNLVCRKRKPDNQRSVEVEITETGKETYQYLDRESLKIIAALLGQIPASRQIEVVEGMEVLASLLDPENEAFQALLKGGCNSQSGERGTE
ncbi:MAG: MarR family transcriptional regulator [Proteobacteria bacterium]|nr:MarR family transcriptional regulator [Pseudomonadota bacterium]